MLTTVMTIPTCFKLIIQYITHTSITILLIEYLFHGLDYESLRVETSFCSHQNT